MTTIDRRSLLTVTGFVAQPGGTVSVDPYVPFKFKAYDNVLVDPLRWRIGDFEHSLFEVLIDRSGRVVRGFTLTLPSKERVSSLPTGYRAIPTETGLPVVDAKDLSEGRLTDLRQPFWALVDRGQAYVLFDALAQPDNVAASGRARFFLSSDKLIGVGVADLADEEQRLLNELLERG